MISYLNRKPAIIIVDDHAVFRHGLKSILTIENLATVIGEASNGKDFIELLSSQNPDLVLMHIDMPGMNGIEATRQALELQPELKIIVFTMFGEVESFSVMIDQGVKGFILKSGGIDELEIAIRDVMKGKNYFSAEIKNKLYKNFYRNKSN